MYEKQKFVQEKHWTDFCFSKKVHFYAEIAEKILDFSRAA